jgi:hypothetical protein
LAVVTIALLVLSVASSQSYASVVVASATVYIVPGYTVSFDETAPDGTLTANGSVRVSLSLLVENPSERTLRIHLVAYGGWIRDWPAEDGLNETRRRSDTAVVNESGTLYFFKAYAKSSEVPPEIVPARGNATLPFSYALDRTGDPVRFDIVRNITDYGVARNGTAESVPWNHWVRVALTIDGALEPSSTYGAAHLRALRRIEREVGENLAP